MILDYFVANWVEIVGAVLSFVYLYFSIREKSVLWVFGFISSALYVYVFFDKKLYAEMSINSYYLFVSIYGWITWRRKDKADDKGEGDLKISHIKSSKEIFQYVAAALLIYLTYFLVLEFLTDSPIAAIDSVIGALSVIATWMLAKKKIENWLVWIVANAYATVLYFSKGLYPTTALFVVYTVMAVIGYFQWKKTMEKQSVEMFE